MQGCAVLLTLFLLGPLVSATNYSNPVIPIDDTPDPGVLLWNGTYYAATTTGNLADRFMLHTSDDGGAMWKSHGFVWPKGVTGAPTWGANSFWAPEIHFLGDQFLMYYVARGTDGMLAVGVATAASPLGPYTDIGAPLVHETEWGNIDPTMFVVDDTAYLVWKRDGNAIGKPTPLFAQPLTKNGTALVPGSSRTELITNDLAWEGPIVEAPWVVQRGGMFYLFYSGSGGNNYAVGVARSSNLLGPWTKAGPPVLHNYHGAKVHGAGHCSVVPSLDKASDEMLMLYHTWVGSVPDNNRHTMLDVVSWNSTGWPVVNGGRGVPTLGPRPLP